MAEMHAVGHKPQPFMLSLSKHEWLDESPFDELRANGKGRRLENQNLCLVNYELLSNINRIARFEKL